jgi:hypothetical protein
MTNKKTFPLAQVLSVTSRKLFCEVDGLYEILQFLTNDDNVFTHQLPRAAQEVTPYIFNEYPALKDFDSSDVNRDNWKEKLAEAEAKFGKFLELEPIPADDHAIKDPRQELSDMVGADKVISVELDDREEWEKDTDPEQY